MAAIIFEIFSVLIFAHFTSSKPYHVNDNSVEAEKLSLLKNPDIKTIIPGKKNVILNPALLHLLRSIPDVIRKEERDIFQDKVKNVDGKINIDHLQHNENSVVINNPQRLSKSNILRQYLKRGNVKYNRHSHSDWSSHSYEDSNDYSGQEEPFIDLTRIEAKVNEDRQKREPYPFGNIFKTNDLIDTGRIDFSSQRSDINSVKSFLVPSIDGKLRAIEIDLPSSDYNLRLRRNAVKEKDLQHILRGGSQISDEYESGSESKTSEEDDSNTKNEPSENNSESDDTLKRFKVHNKKPFSESESDESIETPKRFKLNSQKRSSEGNSDESKDTPKRFKVKKNKNKPSRQKKSKHILKQKRQPVFESAEAESIEFQQPVISTELDQFNESGELSTEEPPIKKRNKNVYHTKQEIYIQSPRRLVKVGPDYKDLRKRLQHFLPKRYHWHEDEFQDLGYFWFNGPQGREPPGPWRVTY